MKLLKSLSIAFLAFFLFTVGVYAQEAEKTEIQPVTVESTPLQDVVNPTTMLLAVIILYVVEKFLNHRTVKEAIATLEKTAGDLRDSIPPNIAEHLYNAIPISAIKKEIETQADPFLEKLKDVIPGEVDDKFIDSLKYILANYDLSKLGDGTVVPVLKK